MGRRSNDVEVRTELENPRATAVQLTLEPWGMPCTFAAHTRFTLLAFCPGGEPFEIETAENGDVTVFAPPSALVHIYGPGGEVTQGWSCTDHRPPGLPPRASMKTFIRSLFG